MSDSLFLSKCNKICFIKQHFLLAGHHQALLYFTSFKHLSYRLLSPSNQVKFKPRLEHHVLLINRSYYRLETVACSRADGGFLLCGRSRMETSFSNWFPPNIPTWSLRNIWMRMMMWITQNIRLLEQIQILNLTLNCTATLLLIC